VGFGLLRETEERPRQLVALTSSPSKTKFHQVPPICVLFLSRRFEPCRVRLAMRWSAGYCLSVRRV
jgi:hypothetical protein